MDRREFCKIGLGSLLVLAAPKISLAGKSSCLNFPKKEVQGDKDMPYNYRIIDNFLHAGGNPLGLNYDIPVHQVEHVLANLKGKGVTTVVSLDVSNYTTLEGLIKRVGLKNFYAKMNSETTRENFDQKWDIIRGMMRNKEPFYVHCAYGADRTGVVIARYLTDIFENGKAYNGKGAWEAIIDNGSHVGSIRGFKKVKNNKNLVLFFWPNIKEEDRAIASLYGIK